MKCHKCGAEFADKWGLKNHQQYENPQCLTRQLETAKAEIERLKKEIDEKEKKMEHCFIDMNLEIEWLRKIADAAEWLDCDESRERPEKYCPFCQNIQSRGHATDCLYTESADQKGGE